MLGEHSLLATGVQGKTEQLPHLAKGYFLRKTTKNIAIELCKLKSDEKLGDWRETSEK